MMKMRIFLAILAIAFLIGCAGKKAEMPATEPTAPVTEAPKATMPAETAPAAPAASGTDVMVSKAGFEPAMLKVSVGTTVTWKVTDENSHSVSAVGGAFRSSTLRGDGVSYSYTFDTAGEYDYLDAVYKSNKGKIVVE